MVHAAPDFTDAGRAKTSAKPENHPRNPVQQNPPHPTTGEPDVENINSKMIRAAAWIGAAVYLLRLATSRKARNKLRAADQALDSVTGHHG